MKAMKGARAAARADADGMPGGSHPPRLVGQHAFDPAPDRRNGIVHQDNFHLRSFRVVPFLSSSISPATRDGNRR
jgi:hypothetical protein